MVMPAPVTQISDGQVQAPTAAPAAPVSQIGDGQIQAPTTAAAPPAVTQINDGQLQAPVNSTATNTTKPASTFVPVTGGASNVVGSMAAAAVGLAAVLLL